MSRRSLGILIMGAWLAGIGWLVKREYWRSGEALVPDASLSLPPGASFYTLSMNRQQIGFASTTIDTVPEGIRLQDVMVIEVPALGEIHRTDTRIDALLSRSLGRRTFNASLQADAGRFLVEGEVLGDSALRVRITANGDEQELRVDLERPIVLPAIMPMHVALGGALQIGNTYTIDLFDPILLQDRNVEIAVVAESTFIVPDSADSDTLGPWFPVLWDTVHAWQIEQRRHGLELRAWIDDLGRVVQASTPLGFTMERSVFEIAYENFRRRDTDAALTRGSAGDVIRQTAIASNVQFARDTMQELQVLVGGVSLKRITRPRPPPRSPRRTSPPLADPLHTPSNEDSPRRSRGIGRNSSRTRRSALVGDHKTDTRPVGQASNERSFAQPDRPDLVKGSLRWPLPRAWRPTPSRCTWPSAVRSRRPKACLSPDRNRSHAARVAPGSWGSRTRRDLRDLPHRRRLKVPVSACRPRSKAAG